jgi:hypothetical protein
MALPLLRGSGFAAQLPSYIQGGAGGAVLRVVTNAVDSIGSNVGLGDAASPQCQAWLTAASQRPASTAACLGRGDDTVTTIPLWYIWNCKRGFAAEAVKLHTEADALDFAVCLANAWTRLLLTCRPPEWRVRLLCGYESALQ